MNKVTEGEWKVDRLNSFRYLLYPEGKSNLHTIAEMNSGVSNYTEITPGEGKANANLIVTAVNQCKAINPENPQAVAEGIEGLYKALQTLIETYIISRGTEHEFVSTRTCKGTPDYWQEAKQALAQVEKK